MLRSCLAFFCEGAQARVPQGFGPAAAEAQRRLQSWGSQRDLSAEVETGTALSLPSPDRSSASSQGWKARAAVSSTPIEAQTLQLSDSEELDVVSANARDTEDLPPQSRAYEELVEVVTRAIEKLSIDWPAEREDVRSKGKLDERFLPSHAQPQCRGLPFFPDLHTEVWRSWEKPVSYKVLSTQTSHYSSILNKEVHGYREMNKVEETLASYLSPESSSSTRSPVLPSKPVSNYISTGGKGLFSGWSSSSMFTHHVAVASLPG